MFFFHKTPKLSKKPFWAWTIFSISALFYCYEYFLRISPSVIANELMADFVITASSLGNLIACYYYIYTPIQLIVGILMDKCSPKYLLILACLSCAGGAFYFAHTHHVQVIGISRIFIGFGSAFAFVGILKFASVWFPKNQFALFSGLAVSLGMIGAITGNNIIALLVDHIGWRNALSYASYMGVVLAILMLFALKDSPDAKLFSKSVVLSGDLNFKKLCQEIMYLIKKPFLWINGVVGGLMFLPISAFAELWGVPFIQSAYHTNREIATQAVTMVFLGMALGGPLSGWISDKMCRRCLPLVTGGILAFFISIIVIFTSGLSLLTLNLLLFTLGVATSVQILVFPMSREMCQDNLAGTAMAFTNMLVMTSGVIFQPLIGYLLDLTWNGFKIHNSPFYTVENYKVALLVIPAGILLSLFLMLFAKETCGKLALFCKEESKTT